jgi:Dolichyl-phosphate-mannose-protein mannosyltransferase
MALMAVTGHLAVVLLVLVVSFVAGLQFLTIGKFTTTDHLEKLLYAAGFSFACLELFLFLFGESVPVLTGLLTALIAISAVFPLGLKRSTEILVALRGQAMHLRRGLGTISSAMIAASLLLSSLLAMAPLTGSDAMHYHFTVPLLESRGTPMPALWLTHSFFTGTGHALISLGLALGSDQIALGFIFLGGVLTAAALFVLARGLMTENWARLAALAFLLTPMTYWQMTTSGSPDIWMAFFTLLAILAAARGVETNITRWFVLSGLFAGAVAGVKYTGWIVPAVIAAGCLLQTRSWRKFGACGLSSLVLGILPLVRNAWLTGDPVFPFLARWFAPGHLNAYAAAAIVADTRSTGFHRSFGDLLAFPFTLIWNGSAYGVGHYLGPLVLAFAPLLLLVPRKEFLVRLAAAVWLVTFLANALTTQMGRFLLPVYPLALALVFAGVAETEKREWRIATIASSCVLVVFLLFGACSEALYARDFLPVVFGREAKETFLNRMAPDYPIADYLNRTLKGRKEKTMVFFRHLYYLRIPYVEGDPQNSWLMNPDQLRKPEELLGLCRTVGVKWIVKAPDYPPELAPVFENLETTGRIRPVAETIVEGFSGWRMYGQRKPIRVVILEIAEASP